MITVILPVPPSTNNLYVNGKRGRFKSQRYKEWEIEAMDWLRQQKSNVVIGAYSMEIKLPEMIRGDIGNREKAISDLLVAEGSIPDDKHAWRISIERNPNIPPGECHVTVRSIKTSNNREAA